MKSAEAMLPVILRRSRPRRDDLEFLPAALEIIESPAAPVGRAIAGTIILFFVAAIIWACLGKVDIIATATGRIIPTGRTKVIQPFETGVVRAIRVSDGQQVKAGDVLIELDPTASQADEVRLRHALAQDQLDLARLKALLTGDLDKFAPPADADPLLAATASQRMEAQAAEQRARLADLDRQIAEKTAASQEAQASIDKIDAVLPTLRGQRDIREQLLHNQFGSKLLYLQAQQQVIEQEQQRIVEQHHLQEETYAVAALARQREGAVETYRKNLLGDLAKAEDSAIEHREDLAKAVDRHALQTLRAPVDGSVQQLAVHTVGGVVTPAEQLMVIVPADSRLEVEATLPNKDVGFVEAGQRVAIKVEAFNFTRYGLLHGTVTSVSRDVVAPDPIASASRDNRLTDPTPPKDDADRQAREPAYVAHVALTETGIGTEQGWKRLEPGMAVTAEVKTGRRRVISYLLAPLLQLRSGSLTER